MPVEHGRGWSQATIDKEDGFSKIMGQHINIVKSILKKHKNWVPQCYYYIDAYAGPGRNPEIDCDGSPLIFYRIAKNSCIPIKSWFIDIVPEHTAQLRKLIGIDPSFQICTGDNRDIVWKISNTLPKNAYGLIYADATGLPDFDMLGHISTLRQLSKFDILIRYSASMIKRTQHVTGRGMRESLRPIDKKEWIIRDILPGDSWQWTFLLGLNWPNFKAWEKQRFYRADSAEGKRIFEMCERTRGERNAL